MLRYLENCGSEKWLDTESEQDLLGFHWRYAFFGLAEISDTCSGVIVCTLLADKAPFCLYSANIPKRITEF